MPPSPDHPFDPEDIPYFFDNWCSLPWTPWVPFSADKQEFYTIPHEPGLYRIRPAGKDFLMYIGETRRTVHERLNELRQNLRRTDLMPWNDPHTAAPSLWAWRDAEHYEYECSAAPLDASINGRRGMESFLLYRYRQERGESTLCNFGRFHPRYRKSTNRKENHRGGRLEADHKDNPAGGPSHAPLSATGKPGDRDWMGLLWSSPAMLAAKNVRDVAHGSGLYLLADAGSREIVYIGQSADVGKRLLSHNQKEWDGRELQFSYHIVGQPVLSHQLKELENDLIGNYFEIGQVIRPGGRDEYEGIFEICRKAPEFQFRSSS